MLPLRSALLAGLFAISSSATAEDADPVVARVGPAVLKASDVERRLSAIPKFQLSALGTNPAQIRHQFVDTVLVPEMLYAAEADRLRLDVDPAVSARIRDAHHRALVDQIRKETAHNGISADEVQAYFASHRSEFEKPERLRIARILIGDEALGRKIIAEARGVGGPERWTKLARENSVDEATKMRGGSLGFVLPDGRTEVPQLHVDPALYAAAAAVKDGEIVAEPVKEGNRFAVVWRRGTLPKVLHTVDDERQQIEDALLRGHVETAVRSLIDDLRKKYVTELAPDLLEGPLPGEAPSVAPSVAPHSPQSADPVPKLTDRGLR